MKSTPALISCIVSILLLLPQLSLAQNLNSYQLQARSTNLEVPFCSKSNTPKNILPIANWDIIAGNVASFSITNNFSGDQLAYSISAHPTNPINKVSISPKTGSITIKAEAKDNFQVTVTVKNPCGQSSATFNVLIDEEI